MYSVSQKSVSYPPFGKIPAPTVNKSAASKKDLSLAVNDETLEKCGRWDTRTLRMINYAVPNIFPT